MNNLRLLIQPFCALCLLLPWMAVFLVPGLIDKLPYLIACVNGSMWFMVAPASHSSA